MTWTYSGDPSANNRDAVRFAVGDTDTADQQLSDEEIAYLLIDAGGVKSAAIAAIRSLIAKFARAVDKSVGDLSVSYSQRLEHYKTLEKTLRADLGIRRATPYAGGISIADKTTDKLDTDRLDPAFFKDQFTQDKNIDYNVPVE